MITKAALLEDLGPGAGIDPHGMLLCHFSMKKIGPVENGRRHGAGRFDGIHEKWIADRSLSHLEQCRR